MLYIHKLSQRESQDILSTMHDDIFMIEYNLKFVETVPDPFTDVDGTDSRRIENFYHVAEMSTFKGQNHVEYGGDNPWIHMSKGIRTSILSEHRIQSSQASSED